MYTPMLRNADYAQVTPTAPTAKHLHFPHRHVWLFTVHTLTRSCTHAHAQLSFSITTHYKMYKLIKAKERTDI